MLSFCTEFPVEEVSAQKFCGAVADWLGGSPHTSITEQEVRDLAASGSGKIARERFDLSCIAIEDAERRSAGFRFNLQERNIVWSTTICFDSNSEDSWVGVRTERHSRDAVPFLPEAKKPLVVRSLMGGLGGGMDGEIRVSDLPHVLTSRDVDMAVRVLNGDSDHHLPVIYVSRPFTGDLRLNVSALARHLGGIAHVLVEPSREFSRSIQPHVFSENPYGGFVGIYYSSQESEKISVPIYEDEFTLRRRIFHAVRSSLLHRRQLGRCSWSNLQADVARRERQGMKDKGSDAVLEYAAIFDKEIEAKDLQLTEAESEIARLRSALMDAGKRSKATGGVSLSVGGEQQLTSDEFAEVVIEALKNQKDFATGRRKDILSAILEANSCEGNLQAKRDEIKSILRGYSSMTAGVRSALHAMGFEIREDGKHYKIIYKGDGRYTFSLPKTGSDHRGGLNAASEISRNLF